MKSSKKLGARAAISDYELMHVKEKKYIEKRIIRELSYSLAEKLVEDAMDRITVVRRFDEETNCYPLMGHPTGSTIYEVECFVLTREEHREYQRLKQFQTQLKEMVR